MTKTLTKAQIRLMKRTWGMGPPYRYRPISGERLDAYALHHFEGLATWEPRYPLFTLNEAGVEWCRQHLETGPGHG